MAIGFNYGSGGKKYNSKSGWERSWFGGYTQMIWDHPSLNVPYELNFEPSESLRKSLGHFGAEKLLKMFILQCKAQRLLGHFRKETVTRKNFFGEEKKYEQAFFDEERILDRVMNMNGELAPLFEHYKEGILQSYAEREIKEDKENDDGDGDGDGESKESTRPGSGEEGEGDEKGKKASGIEGMLGEVKAQEYKSWTQNVSEFDKKPVFKPLPSTTEKYRFEPEEIRAAEHLVKLLDISFDPKSDVVKSLRLGKLDTCKIAEVPAGNLSVYKQIVEEQDTRPFSVCILADMSGSMGGNRIETQFGVLNSLYLAMRQILPEDKLFIYGHSGDMTPEIYTFYSPYEQEYEERISGYSDILLRQNYDGPVIESIHKKIRSITEDRIIFISLSDGEPAGNGYGGPRDNEQLKQILEKCRRDEFVTVGIGIESVHVSNLYTYAKVVHKLEDMAKDVSGIINQVVRQEFK